LVATSFGGPSWTSSDITESVLLAVGLTVAVRCIQTSGGDIDTELHCRPKLRICACMIRQGEDLKTALTAVCAAIIAITAMHLSRLTLVLALMLIMLRRSVCICVRPIACTC